MSAPEMLSPLARHLHTGIFGAEGSAARLLISQHRVDIAQLIARSGETEAVLSAVHGELHLKLPEPGFASSHLEATAIWIAPHTWLVIWPRSGGTDLLSAVRSACGDAAAVADQSSGKTVLRVSGGRARDVLAKGCRIDLHPRAFGPGRAAVTLIAHVHGIIVQRDAVPTFDVIVPSTLAGHVFEWLCVSAAEYGYEIRA